MVIQHLLVRAKVKLFPKLVLVDVVSVLRQGA